MNLSHIEATVSEYDVAIIGAGPAGSAAGYFLATGGLRVVLLDKFDFPRDKICGDGLTPRAIKILAKIGILPQLEKTAFHCSELKIRYSDELTFNLGLENLENLPNYILTMPRLQLDHALLQHAINAGAKFFPKAKVESISRDFDKHIHLEIESGRRIECALAIVATGANTRLLQNLGLSKKT
ncbi:MAG TPA: FAD-dependent monooxygenase, partial [Anaerolineales bacterium]|nr:FAD-dependent monooxygenase [Anaerolineales bacterium]